MIKGFVNPLAYFQVSCFYLDVIDAFVIVGILTRPMLIYSQYHYLYIYLCNIVNYIFIYMF